MNAVMIDLETWGVGTNALVVSIGAIEFNLSAKGGKALLGEKYQANIDPVEAQECGFKIDASTIDWWMQQEKAAQESVRVKRIDIFEAFDGLGDFVRDKLVWSNGGNFDIRILREGYKLLHIPCPWHYRDERDMRTFMDIMKRDGIDVTIDGPRLKHDALADAEYQARLMLAHWERRHAIHTS